MGNDEIKEVSSLNQAQAQQERIVNEMIQHMVDMDMDAFETTLSNYYGQGHRKSDYPDHLQFYETYWYSVAALNHINPAQEHLVSNIIRQKLIVGIESVSTSLRLNKTLILFLPEAEYHELGLLFMYYMLKSRGANVIYLGSNVPISDVAYVANLKKPDYLYSHITTPGQNFNFDRFIQNIAKNFPKTPCIISGQLTQSYEKKIHPPVTFKKTSRSDGVHFQFV